MKKVSISINLEDNEVLEQSIKEAISAQSKQIAREEIAKELTKEIQRIVNNNLKDAGAGYYSKIGQRIINNIVDKLDKELINKPLLDEEEIQKIIEYKVNTYMDKKIKREDRLDSFIQKYIDRSLASALMERANSL